MKVERERWERAQAWELDFWTSGQTVGWKRRLLRKIGFEFLLKPFELDDWNYWWRDQFDGYHFLPNSIGDFIELGCGPFTNARVILDGREAKRVVLSDPLALEYAGFDYGWLAEQYRRRAVLLDDHPIEDCPFRDESFDVVVMNNVLDHVIDAESCLHQAARITRSGGWLLFGQDLTNHEDEAKLNDLPEDIGHPISFPLEPVRDLLTAFEPVLDKVLSREEGRNPDFHYATLIFAGRKR